MACVAVSSGPAAGLPDIGALTDEDGRVTIPVPFAGKYELMVNAPERPVTNIWLMSRADGVFDDVAM